MAEKKNWELNCVFAANCKFELKPKADDSFVDILEVKDRGIGSIKLCGSKWLVGGEIIAFYNILHFKKLLIRGLKLFYKKKSPCI